MKNEGTNEEDGHCTTESAKEDLQDIGGQGKAREVSIELLTAFQRRFGDTLLHCPRAKFCRIDIDGECRMSSAAIIMAQVIPTKSLMVPAEDTGLVENRDYKLLPFSFHLCTSRTDCTSRTSYYRDKLQVYTTNHTPCAILTTVLEDCRSANDPPQTHHTSNLVWDGRTPSPTHMNCCGSWTISIFERDGSA